MPSNDSLQEARLHAGVILQVHFYSSKERDMLRSETSETIWNQYFIEICCISEKYNPLFKYHLILGKSNSTSEIPNLPINVYILQLI